MELKTNKNITMSNTPFKMKGGSSPMKHIFGRHPSKKDGHVKSDHKERRKAKKEASDIEFVKKHGVHPDNTRRYMDGTLINLLTNEEINE
jgi:hypothetical protein